MQEGAPCSWYTSWNCGPISRTYALARSHRTPPARAQRRARAAATCPAGNAFLGELRGRAQSARPRPHAPVQYMKMRLLASAARCRSSQAGRSLKQRVRGSSNRTPGCGACKTRWRSGAAHTRPTQARAGPKRRAGQSRPGATLSPGRTHHVKVPDARLVHVARIHQHGGLRLAAAAAVVLRPLAAGRPQEVRVEVAGGQVRRAVCAGVGAPLCQRPQRHQLLRTGRQARTSWSPPALPPPATSGACSPCAKLSDGCCAPCTGALAAW